MRTVSAYKGATYLSIGTPCVGAKIRIIDPLTLLPCSPGVAGQLQITGTSIFSQYYANPTATRDSFTPDGWFMTGDLALIDDDGNLHMLGRHKDVINVNGVKHPSVDIEHYLADSKVFGVESSLVFACAMRLEGADTETYAVFYQHGSVQIEEATITALTDDAIEAVLTASQQIKNVCSAFCYQAPHVVLPLPHQYFFKSALGKVSRSALAKAYKQGKFSFIERFLTDASVRRIKAHVPNSPRSAFDEIICGGVALVFDLDLTTLDLSQNIFDMGASSMHLIRLKAFLQDRFNLHNIPTIELLQRPIISEISAYVHKLIHQGNKYQTSYNPLLCLNPLGSKPPLYLVHPGVGEVLIFINLARILNDDRPVYALRARGFEVGETPPATMQEMVQIYTDAIENHNPTGPYYLSGYSFGGGIAFEIGKLLEQRGKVVAWLGILNLPPFIQFRVKELVWVETLQVVSFLLIYLIDFFSFLLGLISACFWRSFIRTISNISNHVFLLNILREIRTWNRLIQRK